MAFTEPEVYKEDEVFDECSDEEGDLLIKSAFEEEEVEEGVNEEENVKVKLEGTTKSKNSSPIIKTINSRGECSCSTCLTISSTLTRLKSAFQIRLEK